MAKYVRWLAVTIVARDEGEVCQFVIFLDRFSCNVEARPPRADDPPHECPVITLSPVANARPETLMSLHHADAGSLRRIKRAGRRWRDGILATGLSSMTGRKGFSMLRRHSDYVDEPSAAKTGLGPKMTVYRLTAAFTRLRSTVRHILDAVLQQAEQPAVASADIFRERLRTSLSNRGSAKLRRHPWSRCPEVRQFDRVHVPRGCWEFRTKVKTVSMVVAVTVCKPGCFRRLTEPGRTSAKADSCIRLHKTATARVAGPWLARTRMVFVLHHCAHRTT